jgi:hypothetical protein
MVLLFNLGGGSGVEEGRQVLVHAAYLPSPPFVVSDSRWVTGLATNNIYKY